MLRNLKTRTPVLTYHDFVPVRDRKALWFDCTPAEFKSQITRLRQRGAHFITLRQLYDHLTTNAPLPPHAIALTFADNYLGFYKYAMPVLKAEHIPATMFVHTGFIGDRAHGRPKMGWKELDVISRSRLVDVASQTVTHPPDLGLLPMDDQMKEVSNSKQTLESHLRQTVDWIAYPNGKFNAESVEVTRQAGYLMGMTENCIPAERSPSIFEVARYVHTKYQRAWADCYGGGRKTTRWHAKRRRPRHRITLHH